MEHFFLFLAGCWVILFVFTALKSWRCDKNENSDYGHPPPGLAIEQSRVSAKDEKADPYNFFREYVRLEQHEHSVFPSRFLSLGDHAGTDPISATSRTTARMKSSMRQRSIG
jgi:hypothetical protein